MSSDKRKFPRYAFPKENEIHAQLALPNGGGLFKARLLNISLGGVGLAAEKSLVAVFENLKENSELELQSITGDSALSNLAGQKMLVRWILNYDPLENLGLGCEFVGLNKECQKAINALLKEN